MKAVALFHRLQAEKLKDRLSDTLEIEWAMRYSAPSMTADRIKGAWVRTHQYHQRTQYSASTSARL